MEQVEQNTPEAPAEERQTQPPFGAIKSRVDVSPSHELGLAHKISIQHEKFVQQKSSNLEDDYAIVCRLGSGVYGDVFKIKHKELGLFRALKVIKRDPTKRYSQREEIEVLKSLDHPNILKIFQFYELDNFYYIVTELFEGKELFNEIMDSGVFTENKAMETSYQILKAMTYTHSRKIVHRDIKLQNVLIKVAGDKITIKLIDWGFGSFIKSRLVRVCGTPEYVAPDVFQGNYDEKCDIWSFGVLLYVLLSASFPFRGSTRDETISLIQKAKFTFHSDIWKSTSQESKDFISLLLTKSPQNRPSAQQALKSEWISKHLKNEMNLSELRVTLASFKRIHIQNNMATAAINFITNYLSTQEEKQKLNHIFDMLDTNSDGVLSFDEISKGYQVVYGALVGKCVAQQTFDKLDLNHNGVIEYNEFITHSIDLKKIISGEKMRVAFKMFDSNDDGKINITEIKDAFGYDSSMLEEYHFKTWMDDLDYNGDGEIDENEFVKSLIEICNLLQLGSSSTIFEEQGTKEDSKHKEFQLKCKGANSMSDDPIKEERVDNDEESPIKTKNQTHQDQPKTTHQGQEEPPQ